MSDNGENALRDMVELQMYLLVPPPQEPWPMLPRRSNRWGNMPHRDPIQWSVVAELVDRGFIEHASTATFVVSKSGYEYYRRELTAARLTSGVPGAAARLDGTGGIIEAKDARELPSHSELYT